MIESVQITKVWYENTVKNEQNLNVEYAYFNEQTGFVGYLSSKKPISYFCSNPEEPRVILLLKNDELSTVHQYSFVGNLTNDGLEWFSINPKFITAIDLLIKGCFVKKISLADEYSSVFSHESNCQKRHQEPIFTFSSSNQKQKVHT
jgi:hypothetical protein